MKHKKGFYEKCIKRPQDFLCADIYTTSKLLGHANVNTTAIYAKIVDQKKVETVNLVDDFFSRQPQTEGNR